MTQKKRKKKPNKHFIVECYIQTEVKVSVMAQNGREARKKAHERVAKRQVGHKAIRKDWTEVEDQSIHY